MRISRNRYDATVRDSLLTVTTANDHLELFKNQYNCLLLRAEITSDKVVFGQEIKVGITRAAFCKMIDAKPKHTVYQLTDAPEEATRLRFIFSGSLLQRIEYRILWPLD